MSIPLGKLSVVMSHWVLASALMKGQRPLTRRCDLKRASEVGKSGKLYGQSKLPMTVNDRRL
jgi:hypothetical protein